MFARRLVPAMVVLSLALGACSSNRSESEPRPQGTVRNRIDTAAAGLAKDTMPDTSTVRDTTTNR